MKTRRPLMWIKTYLRYTEMVEEWRATHCSPCSSLTRSTNRQRQAKQGFRGGGGGGGGADAPHLGTVMLRDHGQQLRPQLSISCPTLYRDCMKKKVPLLDSTAQPLAPQYHTCRTPCPLKLCNTWLPGAAATLSKQLDQEVALNRGAAFSDNTKKTYHPHLRSYIAFCEQSGIVPVPSSDVTVAKYAAFLAQRKGLLPLSNTWTLFACCIWSVI